MDETPPHPEMPNLALIPADARKMLGLTQRQLETMLLIAGGRTAKEAALVMGLSARTVEHHRIDAVLILGAGSLPCAIAKLATILTRYWSPRWMDVLVKPSDSACSVVPLLRRLAANE